MEWFDLTVVTGSLPEFWRGLWMTLHLTGIALIIGFGFAVPLSIARVSKNPWVSAPVRAYTYFFRGTPMLVQLLLVYYGIGQSEWMQQMWEAGNPFWLLFRDAYFCALLAFSLNTCAYQLEMFAGGDPQYAEWRSRSRQGNGHDAQHRTAQNHSAVGLAPGAAALQQRSDSDAARLGDCQRSDPG
jgi:His/Glu/Gln/Arg/opine family amino acid ABC transporter permease subunit